MKENHLMCNKIANNKSVNLVFDLINKAELFGDKQIDIIIINKSNNNGLWFKGKDVADILRYKKTRNAIISHVRNKNKMSLIELYKEFNSPEQGRLKGNQKNSIYINEAGLYQLIMKSELEIAEQFQDWITDDLLPKIRKIGQEKFIKELELKNKQLEEFNQQLAEKDKLLLEFQEQLEHQKRGVDQIKAFINNSKERTKNHRIYIAFCPIDAKANLFKVGGCQSANLLKTRLGTYNTDHATDNLCSFAAIWNCHDFNQVEARVKQMIGEFRQPGKREVYMMHYKCLFTIIDYIVNHYNEENDEVNNFIRNIVHNMTELKPIIPEPIKLDRYEIVEIKDGEEVRRNEIIFNNMTSEEQEKLIKDLLEKLIKDLLEKFRKPEQNIIKRGEFEKYLLEQGLTNFKKRTVWVCLKKIVSNITELSLLY